MGIRFTCPNGHKLHVKTFLAGKRGVCPKCGAKILIPSAEDSQPSINGSATDVSEGKRAEATLAKGGTAEAFGSQSIIIALADMPVVAQPPVETAQRPEKSPPPIDSNSLKSAATQTVIDSRAAASPAKRYVAYRERARRNQLNIAIALLVAVIVLALVLIFVLQGSAGPLSACGVGPTQRQIDQRSPYVVATMRDKILLCNSNNRLFVL